MFLHRQNYTTRLKVWRYFSYTRIGRNSFGRFITTRLHKKELKETLESNLRQGRVRMFTLVPTFYNRVNFLLGRLALLNDLRYDLTKEYFTSITMHETRMLGKNMKLQSAEFKALLLRNI